MVNEQIDWTQEMKSEFATMIEENRQRIRLMQEEYDELKQLFDDRPSKEEDMRLIQKLQQLLEQVVAHQPGEQLQQDVQCKSQHRYP
jgi:uncharacterized protein Yka (UPF0111/DUF47 family)